MNGPFKLTGDSERPYTARVVDADGNLVPHVYSFNVHATAQETKVEITIGAAYEFTTTEDIKYVMFDKDGHTVDIPDPRSMMEEIKLLKEIYSKAWEVWIMHGTPDNHVFDLFVESTDGYERFIGGRNHGGSKPPAGETAIRAIQEEDQEVGRPPDQDPRVEPPSS